MKNIHPIDRQMGLANGSRIPLLEPTEMSPEQLRVYEEVVLGPRGRMIGPLRAAIHSPELAQRWARFGEFLRYSTNIPPRYKELAILVTARRWNCQVEWSIHTQEAERAGLPIEVIEAVGRTEEPPFVSDEDVIIYEFTRRLHQHGHVDLPTYEAVRTLWGNAGVVELTALIGYYGLVAMTLNVHEMPVPEGCTASLPPAATHDLSILPPAGLGKAKI